PDRGGRAECVVAYGFGRGPARPDLGSMGGLSDLQAVSTATGVLRRPQRLLRAGAGGGVPVAARGDGRLARGDAAARVRARAAPARLAVEHDARSRARLAPRVRGRRGGPVRTGGRRMTATVLALFLGCAAVAADLRSGHIPNRLTAGGAAAAFLFHVATAGARGAATSLAGAAVALALFLLPYLRGGLGGG